MSLDLQASDAIRARRLPPQRPNRVWGGPGLGESCAVCRLPVGVDQLGFEFDVTLDLGFQVTTQLHVRCFRAWERACAAAAAEREPPGFAGEAA